MATMKKLRWAVDGGFWDLDLSTPKTIDGLARPVPSDLLPLGLSRGTRLSRPKQIDFMQRFMAAPFVPSFSGDPKPGKPGSGLSLQRVLTLPLGENWFATLLGQFNLQKFVSSVKKKESESSWFKEIKKNILDKSFYALNLSSEMLVSPDDTLLVSLEEYGHGTNPRKKAVLHHKFKHHNLTVEAVSPGLFVGESGTYWDVPLSMSVDLASVSSDSGASYHLSMHHNSGTPEVAFGSDQTVENGVPATLLQGLALKGAFAFKKNVDIWRSKAQKLKMVQPYDVLLSNPHISASGTIGAAMTTSVGDNSARLQGEDSSHEFRGLCLNAEGLKSALLADVFGSVSFTAQHGNFQRLFLDLTRLHMRLDFPSGTKFVTGATHIAQDLLNSQNTSLEMVRALCPEATVSLQQQIAGPFSFRVDSRVAVDLNNKEHPIRLFEPIFAIEHSLHVLGSAKGVAWYSPKNREFMVELRFFET